MLLCRGKSLEGARVREGCLHCIRRPNRVDSKNTNNNPTHFFFSSDASRQVSLGRSVYTTVGPPWNDFFTHVYACACVDGWQLVRRKLRNSLEGATVSKGFVHSAIDRVEWKNKITIQSNPIQSNFFFFSFGRFIVSVAHQYAMPFKCRGLLFVLFSRKKDHKIRNFSS